MVARIIAPLSQRYVSSVTVGSSVCVPAGRVAWSAGRRTWFHHSPKLTMVATAYVALSTPSVLNLVYLLIALAFVFGTNEAADGDEGEDEDESGWLAWLLCCRWLTWRRVCCAWSDKDGAFGGAVPAGEYRRLAGGAGARNGQRCL